MGRSKAWLPFGPEVMLQRVVRALGEVADPVVVVAAPGQELPDLPAAVAVAYDEIEDRGPLQGIAAGLQFLSGRVEAAYVSGTDTPFLTAAFVREMADLLGAHAMAVPRVDGRYHPLAAVYRTDVIEEVRLLLSEEKRRPMLLLDRLAARVVSAEELSRVDPGLVSLRNINAPEDYDRALADAAPKQG